MNDQSFFCHECRHVISGPHGYDLEKRKQIHQKEHLKCYKCNSPVPTGNTYMCEQNGIMPMCNEHLAEWMHAFANQIHRKIQKHEVTYRCYLVGFIEYKTGKVVEWGIFSQSAGNLTVEIGRVYPVDMTRTHACSTMKEAKTEMISILSHAPHYFYDWLAPIKCRTPDIFWEGMDRNASFFEGEW